jgi:tetratricopeptide (TPR) repeat protein
LEARLDELQALEFIHQIRRLPEQEFTFKHALTYQVAYRSLLSDRRRTMHATILRSMEQRHLDRTSDHAEELARHALHAADWDKTLRYTFEAGKKAFDRSAHRETVQHLDEALRALRKLGDGAENRQLGVDVRFLLRYALLNLGEVERVGQLLTETRPLIQALDLPQRTAQFEAFQSNYYCLSNDQTKAVQHGLHALRIAETEQDRALRIEMAFRLAQPYYQLARYSDAIEILEAAVALIGPEEASCRFGMSALPAVVCRTWLTLCHAELGAFSRARDHASAAVSLVNETDHPLSAVFAYWGQGHLYLYQRDYAQAVSTLQRGFEVSRRWSLRSWLSRLASALGLARALSGEADAGVALIEQALAEAEATHFAVDAPRLLERLATAHLMAGRHGLAETKAAQALALATGSGARGHQAWTLRLLGEISTAAERFDGKAVEENFTRALGLTTTLGMRPLAVLCHEGLSRLHSRRGHQPQAEEALRQARSLWSTLNS